MHYSKQQQSGYKSALTAFVLKILVPLNLKATTKFGE